MRRDTPHRTPKGASEHRATALAVVLALQAVAAVFFVGDVLADVTFDGLDLHLVLEGAVAVALIFGVLFGASEMRRVIERTRRSETALSAARGAMTELIAERFADWNLTPAEGEVALLALKGFDVGEIAELRGAAAGTVRAQLARVYAKASVSSRAELLSRFMDDLIAGPLAGHPAAAEAAPHPAA
ncbi:MAG: helix-turn-helix transcriptional regulator [Pseudomonadota bacterium]